MMYANQDEITNQAIRLKISREEFATNEYAQAPSQLQNQPAKISKSV